MRPLQNISILQRPICFSKGASLYGLDKARQSATAEGRFYLVEGYFDVITLHEYGITNVVAPLGTALTAEHVQVLQRFVPSVTCWYLMGTRLG